MAGQKVTVMHDAVQEERTDAGGGQLALWSLGKVWIDHDPFFVEKSEVRKSTEVTYKKKT